MKIDLFNGDCLEVLKTLPDNSVDSVVTDPPYGLSFMNKAWDYDVPTQEVWAECLRVLKPGGHLISFAGSRTYHRMAVRIEDAGFEIRDQIMWVYGSGFPKSHNIGKAIDKIEGNEREVIGEQTSTDIRGGNLLNSISDKGEGTYKIPITKGNSKWEGWGTALKPAHEPMVLARKPLSEKSIAENVLKHGTGGLNIDGSRIETTDKHKVKNTNFKEYGGSMMNISNLKEIKESYKGDTFHETHEGGRFPANIIFDEEAGQLLDEQSGISKSSAHKIPKRTNNSKNILDLKTYHRESTFDDKGGASRFFYCPKASKKDRNEGLDNFEEKALRQTSGGTRDYNARCAVCGKKFIGPPEKICRCEEPVTDNQVFKQKNSHPTVKPTDLMRYLINLITPPNGVVLDPFMGSGSTGKAAVRCGVNFIGIEKEQEYIDIARARIEYEKNKPVQGKLL